MKNSKLTSTAKPIPAYLNLSEGSWIICDLMSIGDNENRALYILNSMGEIDNLIVDQYGCAIFKTSNMEFEKEFNSRFGFIDSGFDPFGISKIFRIPCYKITLINSSEGKKWALN